MATKKKTTPAQPAKDGTPGYRFTRDVNVEGLKFTAGRTVIEGEIPAGDLASLVSVGWLVACTTGGDGSEQDPAPEDDAASADSDDLSAPQ